MGPISASVSSSASATSGAHNQFGNVQQGDNSSGGAKSLPIVILGVVGVALIGGLVWLVSRK